MSVVTAQKIFLDPDEELNFIIDKVIAAEKAKVILVIPEGTVSLDTLTAIKVLAKIILSSNKLVTLVSESEVVTKFAKRGGLVCVEKVSDVTPLVWERVSLNKERDLALMAKHQNKLLNSRQEQVGEENEMPASDEAQSQDLVEPSVSEDTVEEETRDIEEESPEIAVVDDIVAVSEPEEPSPEEVEKPLAYPEKGRIPPKLVQLDDDFELVAGGDIVEYNQQAEIAAMKEQENKTVPAVIEGDVDVEIGDGRVEDIPIKDRSFLGQDWGIHTKGAKSAGNKLPQFNISDMSKKVSRISILKSRQQRIAAAVVAIVALIFVGVYIAAQNASLILDLKVKSAEVNLSEVITADAAAVDVDQSRRLLPAKVIELAQPVSRSESAQTTGKGKTGDKAGGLIDFYNKTSNAITIASGTKITNTLNGLIYVVQQDFSVDAASGASTPGLARDIRVQAETFGDKYNATGSTENNFKVANFNTDDIIAIRIRDFTGGTEKEIQVVSQADIDKVKKSLEIQVKDLALNELRSQVPTGYVLLAGTEEYKEQSATADPKLNEEATSFDFSLTGVASALAVSQEQLKSVLIELVKANSSLADNIDTNGISLPEINNVKRTGGKATFQISASDEVKAQLDENKLKQDIAGKSLDDLRLYLAGLESVENFTIDYSPGFLPEFLKSVPNAERIRIRTQ